MLQPTSYHQDIVQGFHVATCEMPYFESISTGIFIPVGSRHETEAENGAAHFAEHMIFKGTEKRSAQDLAIAIEGSGGTINAFTTEDQTCLETRGPSELFPHFLTIMSDMLWHSTFPHEEVEREREVIAEEIIMYYENPSDHIQDLLSEALWSDHPMGKPITGTEASILGIHADALKQFTHQHYHSEGIAICVAGNISHSEVLSQVRSILPSTPTQPKSTYTPYKAPSHRDHSPPLIHDQRSIEQSHLALAFHTEGRHSESRHILRMLSLLLGETMSSRLFQELREKRGLCYHIASDFSLYEDTGTIEIHAGLDSERLEESVTAITTVLQSIIHQGFTEKELEQAQRFAIGQARIGLETPQSQMSWMGDSLTAFGTIVDPIAARNILSSVSLQDLQQFAQQTFTKENLAVASIGPHSRDHVQTLIEQMHLD